MTVRRTSALLRSRTPRTYSSWRSSALGADHAAVGDDADAADAKTRAQPVDDRHKGGHVGGIAGPQLAAQRPAVLIHDQPDDHLMEIRAVVFRVAATTKLLAALAFGRTMTAEVRLDERPPSCAAEQTRRFW